MYAERRQTDFWIATFSELLVFALPRALPTTCGCAVGEMGQQFALTLRAIVLDHGQVFPYAF